MSRARAAAVALVLAVSACGGDGTDGGGQTGGGEAPRPLTPEERTVQRFVDRLPDTARVRPRGCPFECCVYRDWTPGGDVPVRSRPRADAPVVDTLPGGEEFSADSGHVRIVSALLVPVVEDLESRGVPVAVGDTVVVLDYVGEGFYNVWAGDSVLQVPQFWPDSAGAATLGRYEAEWWVHATRPDGSTGWFRPSDAGRLVGADACG